MAGNVKWDDRKLKQQVAAAAAGGGMERAVLMVESDAKRFVAVDTGRLRSSITHEIERSKNEIVGRVGTNVVYGIVQEYGSSRMPAHPYLRPSLAKNLNKIRQLFGGK